LAYARDPTRTDIRTTLGESLIEVRQYREAIGHFEYCLQQKPNDATALVGLARCWFDLGEPDKAEQLLQTALDKGDGEAHVMAERGKLALHMNRPEEAETWLRKALETDPHESTAPYQLQLCLVRLGKTEEAEKLTEQNRNREKDFQRIHGILTDELRSAPPSAALYHELGTLLIRHGRQQGVLWLYKALTIDPNYQPTHAFLADFWEKQGKPEKAAEHRALIVSDDAKAP